MSKALVTLLLLAMIGGLGLIYSGVYPVGADDEHTLPVTWMLETLRERSVARAAKDIDVPDLSDPALLLAGGPDYNEMCAGCHLRPGVVENDLTIGLYPSPPNLTSQLDEHGHDHSESDKTDDAARRAFWIIKHGIKASGMPAWGPTHDDERIWAMVAFLQSLPALSEDQYQILTARGSDDGGEHH